MKAANDTRTKQRRKGNIIKEKRKKKTFSGVIEYFAEEISHRDGWERGLQLPNSKTFVK